MVCQNSHYESQEYFLILVHFHVEKIQWSDNCPILKVHLLILVSFLYENKHWWGSTLWIKRVLMFLNMTFTLFMKIF